MAKFKPVLGDLRGKVAGNVFSRNTYGAYVRQKVTPVNPNTQYQQIVRGRLRDIAQRYQAELTDGQRQSWAEYARNNPIKDVFGDTIYLTAIAMYQHINQLAIMSGASYYDDPPKDNTPAGEFLSASISLKEAGPLVTVTYTILSAPINWKLLIYGIYPLNEGQLYFPGKFKFLGPSGPAPASPLDITSAWTPRLGSPLEDMIGAARLIVLNTDSIKISQPIDIRATCVA